MKGIQWVLLTSVVLLALVGCSFSGNELVDVGQPVWNGQDSIPLEPGQPVGQTFVAQHGGLKGIEFYLVPDDTPAQSLTLHLRAEPQAKTDLATTSLPLPSGAAPGFYRFSFPPQSTSHGQYYYAFVDAAEPGITVALSVGDTYLDGAAYQNHEPLDAQTTFSLAYAPGLVILDLVRATFGWLGLLAAAGLLFVVPGWALLAWLLPTWPLSGRNLSWAEMLGLAVGVSLALYPVLFLLTDLVGLHLGPLYAWGPAVLGVAALVWRYRSWRPRQAWVRLRAGAQSKALWPDLTLLVLLGLVFGVRLLVVRTLDVPMWGDSYQHTLIAQLLVDKNGLFDSWEPYTGIDRFSYHFGFHSASAVLHWLTGLSPIKSTLWAGQLLNGLAILALYPLATRVTGSRWGGVWAVLLAGLLSPMPMSYTNWGRYTQLAGQAILPAAAWLTWEAVDKPERDGRLLALTILVGGGLALTHYRVLIFYGVFVLALALVTLRRDTWREMFFRLGWIAVGAGALFLPWFVNAFGAGFINIFWIQATTLPSQAHPFTWQYNAIGGLETFLAPVWWLAMLLGLGIGLWHRRRGVLLAGLWWFLLLVLTNPAWLSLPGSGIISNFALFVSIYIPAAMFSGVLVAHLVGLVDGRKWALALVAFATVLLGLWGIRERMEDINPIPHALVTRSDVRAAAWIQANTPPEARFLTNSFFAFGGGAIVGSDGGWWLPLLAKRSNTVPPLNYSSDLPADSDYRQRIDELARQVQAHRLDAPEILTLLRAEGVTHVYIGQRQGRVNYAGEQILDPEQLVRSDNYDLVYHQDRVWIFALDP
jgi:hypothetical protein